MSSKKPSVEAFIPLLQQNYQLELFTEVDDQLLVIASPNSIEQRFNVLPVTNNDINRFQSLGVTINRFNPPIFQSSNIIS